MSRRPKVLQVTAADITVKALLLPLIERLQQEGLEVHAACSDGPQAKALKERGLVVHTLPIHRSVAPLRNLKAVVALYRLIRRQKYDVVHVHTPVASFVGRLAARAAGTPVIVYTAHGFYFHDRMRESVRRPIIWLERLWGRLMTDMVFTQSAEDARTAVQERICPKEKVLWIGNGVDTGRFGVSQATSRGALGLSDTDVVVGFVGRVVREKGILELIEATAIASKQVPGLKLLIVGDTLQSDRDKTTGRMVRMLIDSNDLSGRVVFTGFVDDVRPAFSAMDILALPSYREGMPRTIIEAMAAGKPVVATDIRGCREEVLTGVTGYLVPPGDSDALAKAIVKLASDRARAAGMGEEGRRRAAALFDERLVLDRQMAAYRELLNARVARRSGRPDARYEA